MLDLAIRGGDVVDGTGTPRRRADVGVAGGRVVELGNVGEAAEELDASGMVVTPGFVDVHTHVDAQLFWDGALSPYTLHGVTSMFAGNTGFTLAPLPEGDDYLVRMLSVVEGMPIEALRAGVPGDWRTTSEYLDRADGTTAANVGFMVGHSALRRVVMGDDAVRRAALPHEVEAMAALLASGLAAGAVGFSSSWGAVHVDAEGVPVPSRWAGVDELVALAGVCRSYPGTSLEFIPPGMTVFDEEQLALLSAMSAAAGCPLNWNVLRVSEQNRDFVEGMLAAGEYAEHHGGRVVALNMPEPTRARFSFKTGFALEVLPGWGPLFAMAVPERIAALRDPVWRRRMVEGAARADGQLAVGPGDWATRVVMEVGDPSLRHSEGRTVGEIAAAQGKEPFDALVDLVCDDALATTFSRPPYEQTDGDWKVMLDAWRSGRAVIGASDAGAHLDFSLSYDYQVFVLEHAVRRRQIVGLEEAVHFLTQAPARLYGMDGRGTVDPARTPTSSSWTRTPSGRARSAPATTCPRVRAASTPSREGSPTWWSPARRWCSTGP
jgi:N-acyl-D-aspartate/D-glutamate deacylase